MASLHARLGVHRSACFDNLLCFFRKRLFSAAVILVGPLASVGDSVCTCPFATGATSAIAHYVCLFACAFTFLVPGRVGMDSEVVSLMHCADT